MIEAYDKPELWASAGIFKRPEFDVEGYQKKINRIVGVSPSGAPIVQLIWAWDARKWENTEWDLAGNATAGEWRQKYRALTIEIGGDDYVDIAPPRWILEERYEPEAIAHSWELTRYRKVVTGQPNLFCPSCHVMKWISMEKSEPDMAVCRFCGHGQLLTSINQDVWGGVPREGWYNLLPHIGIIANHENKCCRRLWEESREICYGNYKEPDGKELKRLKKGVFLRNKELATNPHIRPELDEVALQQAKRWGLQIMEDQKVKKRSELADIRRAHKYDHLNRIYA